MRQLMDMVEGRRMEAWTHTAAITHLTAMVNRDPKKPAPNFEDFHPYMEKNPIPTVPITVLRDVFVDGKPPVL